VDTDMLKRFSAAIDSDDSEIISKHQKGYETQKLEFLTPSREGIV
jgi:hypothetical protein